MEKTKEISHVAPIRPIEWHEDDIESSLSQENTGKPLHEIFSRDTKETCPSPDLQISRKEIETPSFWEKVSQTLPWVADKPKETTIDLEAMQADEAKIKKTEPIGPIPRLDPPPHRLQDRQLQALLDSPAPMPSALASLPQTNVATTDLAPTSDLLLSKEEMLVYIRSIKDLNRKIFMLAEGMARAQDTEGMISKDIIVRMEQVKKALDRVLEKISQDLESEKQVSRYLGIFQAVAGVATAVSAFAMLIPGVNAAAVMTATAIGATTGALTIAAKTYYEAKKTEHTKELEDLNYSKTRTKEIMQDSFDRIGDSLEANTRIREILIKISRLNHRLAGMMIQ